MAKYDSFVYTGKCPYLKSPQSIRVETSEIHILGNLSPGYKKVGYFCDYSEDCPHLDEYGRCPVFISAPNEPR